MTGSDLAPVNEAVYEEGGILSPPSYFVARGFGPFATTNRADSTDRCNVKVFRLSCRHMS